MEEIITKETVALEAIQSKIYEIRGVKVMLDSDLARLYGVETKVLNQSVRRNLERFEGEDFMFELSKDEYNSLSISLRSQIVTLNNRGKHIKYAPLAFTELGVAMLSSVLRSQTAIEVNRMIMRAFVEIRHLVANSNQVVQRIEVLEYHQLEMQQRQDSADKRIEQVFQLMERNNEKPQQGVFYNGQIYDAYTFISDLVRSANTRIILIDNYIDDTVLTLLDKRNEPITATVYTSTISQKLKLDLEKHNAQYSPIEIKTCKAVHDRFLIIDGQLYHIGASIKDLGKKLFAFSLMQELTAEELLQRIG